MGKGSKPGERRGGRKPGVPNKVNVATRERIAREADPIGFFIRVAKGDGIEAALDVLEENKRTERVLIHPTLDQRIHAQGMLLRKILPDAKTGQIKMNLPAIEKPSDIVTALGALIGAVVDGTMAPEDAHTLAEIIETKRRAIETVDHEARLAALEVSKGGTP
jgi:hypothetical protein